MDQIVRKLYEFLDPVVNFELVTIGDNVRLTPGTIILSLFVLVAFNYLSKLLQKILSQRVLKRLKLEISTEYIILKLIHYLVMMLGIMIVFGTLGFDLSSITVIAGLLSVGVGFGLQTLASNFVSGLILLFEAPVKVGDWVQVGDLEGEVKSINLRVTGIETLDGRYILVPNQDLITSQVINGSKGPPYVRIHTEVGVSYKSDMKLVVDTLQKVARENPRVLKTPEPEIWMIAFGSSSVDFDMLCWIANPREELRVRSELYYAAWWALKEHNIEIPFPQRDLHFKSSDVPLPGLPLPAQQSRQIDGEASA